MFLKIFGTYSPPWEDFSYAFGPISPLALPRPTSCRKKPLNLLRKILQIEETK